MMPRSIKFCSVFLLATLVGCESFFWDPTSNVSPIPGERKEVLPRQVAQANTPQQATLETLNIPLATPWYADYSSIDAQYGQPANHQIHGFSAPRQFNISNIHPNIPPLFISEHIITVSKDGIVFSYSLDALNHHRNIQPLWTHDLRNEGIDKRTLRSGGMTIAGDALYITAGSSIITALSLQDGKPLWVRDVLSPLHTAPLAYKDIIIALGMDNHLYALHRLTGELQWMHRTSEEAVVMHGNTQLLLHNGVLIVPYSNGQLTGINPDNGQELWTLNLAYTRFAVNHIQLNDIGTTPAIQGHTLVVASNAGVLYGIDIRNGQRLWQTGMNNLCQLWIAGQYVFTLSSDHKLTAVSLKNGTIQWQVVLEATKGKDKQRQFFGPILANNQLVIAASDGKIELRMPQNGNLQDSISLPTNIIATPRVWQQHLWIIHNNGLITRFE